MVLILLFFPRQFVEELTVLNTSPSVLTASAGWGQCLETFLKLNSYRVWKHLVEICLITFGCMLIRRYVQTT